MRAAATNRRSRLLAALGVIGGAAGALLALRVATADGPAPAALEGSVRNTAGEGLARITVRVTPLGAWRRLRWDAPHVETTTAVDGRFRIERFLAGAEARVDLCDAQASRRRALLVTTPSSGALDLGALTLSTGASLEARVREEDGSPARYAHVGAFFLGPAGLAAAARRPDVTARADREGRARLEWLWPGEWRVEGRLHSGAVRWSARVTISEGDYVEWRERSGELALEAVAPSASATVRVLVVDAAGRPRAGMRVAAAPLRDPPPDEGAGTDAWREALADFGEAQVMALLVARGLDDDDDEEMVWRTAASRLWVDSAVTGEDGRALLRMPPGRVRVTTAERGRGRRAPLPSEGARRETRPPAQAEARCEGGASVEVRLEVPPLEEGR